MQDPIIQEPIPGRAGCDGPMLPAPFVIPDL
jgi:hypothetical protein